MIGERIEEWILPAGKEYHPDTRAKFRKFFDALPQEIKDEIIIVGTVNTLLLNFPLDRRMNKFIDFLLQDEKSKIKYKRYVRYA